MVLLPSGEVLLTAFDQGSTETAALYSNGVTDAAGVATCAISPGAQPLGPGVVSAVFAGDAFYLPSSASASTIVFAFFANGRTWACWSRPRW